MAPAHLWDADHVGACRTGKIVTFIQHHLWSVGMSIDDNSALEYLLRDLLGIRSGMLCRRRKDGRHQNRNLGEENFSHRAAPPGAHRLSEPCRTFVKRRSKPLVETASCSVIVL